MTARTVELADLGERAAADLLREVAEQEEVLTVRLPEGEAVTIQLCPHLEPLPKLSCIVPKDWKDAIDGPGE